MQANEVQDALKEIFQSALSYEGPLTRETTPKDVSGWDSFGAMQLVFAIEERFQIEIPITRIPELDTVGKIMDFIQQEKA